MSQFYSIRKNLLHIVAVVDPSSEESLHLIFLLSSFFKYSLPIRYGLLFSTENEVALDIAEAFFYIQEEASPESAWTFLANLYEACVDQGAVSTQSIPSLLAAMGLSGPSSQQKEA